jgi:hypothetical protein
VDFVFNRQNMCFGPSPRISLTNLPAEAVSLKISLRDLDHPGADHGGGTVSDFSSGVIPTCDPAMFTA